MRGQFVPEDAVEGIKAEGELCCTDRLMWDGYATEGYGINEFFSNENA